MFFLVSHSPRFRKFWIRLFKNSDFNCHLGPKISQFFFLVLRRHLFFRLEAKRVGGWGNGTVSPACDTDPLIKVLKAVIFWNNKI